MGNERLIESLRAAVEAAPRDVTLRLHLAELLLDEGRRDEAVQQLGHVLQVEPTSTRALELLEASGDSTRVTPPAGDETPGLEVDWAGLERELDSAVPPMFVESSSEVSTAPPGEARRETVVLADVGGLADVKERLELAFLAPLRNPDLRRLYGKDLRGGLLLYGPPGCGKGFIARALAGELQAAFIEVSINDVLDMYVGNSER